MGVADVEPAHDIERSDACGQQHQEHHRPQGAEPHYHLVVTSVVHQLVQVAVGHHPQSEEVAAHLQLAGGILQLAAVVLGEVLQVEPVDAHDDGHGEDVQFEQPEVADDGASVILEVLLDGALPPVGEGSLGRLLAAWARRLQGVGLAGHGALLVVEGESEVGRILVGLVGLVAPPERFGHPFN